MPAWSVIRDRSGGADGFGRRRGEGERREKSGKRVEKSRRSVSVAKPAAVAFSYTRVYPPTARHIKNPRARTFGERDASVLWSRIRVPDLFRKHGIICKP